MWLLMIVKSSSYFKYLILTFTVTYYVVNEALAIKCLICVCFHHVQNWWTIKLTLPTLKKYADCLLFLKKNLYSHFVNWIAHWLNCKKLLIPKKECHSKGNFLNLVFYLLVMKGRYHRFLLSIIFKNIVLTIIFKRGMKLSYLFLMSLKSYCLCWRPVYLRELIEMLDVNFISWQKSSVLETVGIFVISLIVFLRYFLTFW